MCRSTRWNAAVMSAVRIPATERRVCGFVPTARSMTTSPPALQTWPCSPVLWARDPRFSDTAGWSNRASHDGGIIYMQEPAQRSASYPARRAQLGGTGESGGRPRATVSVVQLAWSAACASAYLALWWAYWTQARRVRETVRAQAARREMRASDYPQ